MTASMMLLLLVMLMFMYERRSKSFEPKHIRLQFLSQSLALISETDILY